MAIYEDQGTAYDPYAVGYERVGRKTAPAARSLRIGTATLTYTADGAVTTYDDATSYGAQPHDTPHYDEIARRCGHLDIQTVATWPLDPTEEQFAAARLVYCREHEACHHIVAEWIGGHTSRVLWPLAHGREPDPFEATAEEALAMTFQRWLRANERPIIGGVPWDDLKARALALLEGAA